MYLPALRKVRRISSSDRGDYFLGTDFTYEDMKKAGKIEKQDFDYQTLGEEEIEINEKKIQTYKVAVTAKSKDIAKELGFSRSVIWVNPDNWIIVRSDYWDIKDRYLKTYTATNISQVDGIWTKHQLDIINHKTGHSSRFEFYNVDYSTAVPDEVFTRRTLERGLQ